MVEHSRFHRARANDIDTDACAGEFERRRLRNAFHSVLAADIHCRSWAADLAIRRRDVHNAAFALPKHGPNLVLHAQKYTEHIGVEDVLIRFGSYIGSGAGIADRSSVIDGNVQTTETSNGLVDEVFDFVFMAHISAHKFGLGAEVAQLSSQLLTCIIVPTRDDDPRSFLRKSPSRSASDACQCSCN